MSKTLEKEGSSICARKTRRTHCHSPTAVATTESTLPDPKLETFAPDGRWCQHTKCAPATSEWKYLVVGVARSVYRWLGGKKTDKIESSDKISSQESLKTCTKKISHTTQKLSRVVVVVVVDFICSRWSNRQSLLKGTYWRRKKRRKGQKIEIWVGRINWLNHYGMNYNTELENYIQLLMSPTVNEMNLG